MRLIRISRRYSINVVNDNMVEISDAIAEVTPKLKSMLSLSEAGRSLAGKYYADPTLELAEELVENYDAIYKLSNEIVGWCKESHAAVTGWSGSLYKIYHENKEASDPALRALNYAGKALGSNAVRFKELRTQVESDLEVIKQIRRVIKKARTASRNDNTDKAKYMAQDIRTSALRIVNEVSQLQSRISDCAKLLQYDKQILQKITDRYNQVKSWDWEDDLIFAK